MRLLFIQQIFTEESFPAVAIMSPLLEIANHRLIADGLGLQFGQLLIEVQKKRVNIKFASRF
ncbi:MAG: hypothetical protein ABJF04_14825 [Reichenbachiella sp.]|uniref:hypothetical protein n=1 Tax=Reichenbachiella sp. TaxID=2184521 RepID=UPI0032634CAE